VGWSERGRCGDRLGGMPRRDQIYVVLGVRCPEICAAVKALTHVQRGGATASLSFRPSSLVAATRVVWIGMSSRDCGHDLKSYHTPLRIQPATAALHILTTKASINSLIPPRNLTDRYPPPNKFHPHSHHQG
jgi:hypothetical protein